MRTTRRFADALGYLERHAAVDAARRRWGIAIAGRTGSSRRRSGIGRRAPAIRSCTRTCSSPTSTLGADGRWSALDGRRIYAHAQDRRLPLRGAAPGELTRELGVEWTPVRNGIADVAGVPPAVLRAFSRRRAEIEAEIERRGTSGAAAAQVATLATRRGEDYRVTPDAARAGVARAGGSSSGFDRRRGASGRAARSAALVVMPGVVDAIAERLAGAGRADAAALDVHAARRRSRRSARRCQPARRVAADVERLADDSWRRIAPSCSRSETTRAR